MMRLDDSGVQSFSRQLRFSWKFRVDAVVELGFIIAGLKMMSPHPPQMLGCNEVFYTSSDSSKEMSI